MSRDTETQLDECKLMYRVNDVSLWAFAYTINTRRPPVDIFSEMRVRKKLKGVLVQQNIFLKKIHGHIRAQIQPEYTETMNFPNRPNIVCNYCYHIISYYLGIKHNNQIFKKTANLRNHLHVSHYPVFHNFYIGWGFK